MRRREGGREGGGQDNRRGGGASLEEYLKSILFLPSWSTQLSDMVFMAAFSAVLFAVVYLSRVSVCRIDLSKQPKILSDIFSAWQPHRSSFLSPCSDIKFPQRSVKYVGIVNNLQLILRPIHLRNGIRWAHGYCKTLIGIVISRRSICVSIPTTLSDLERRDARGAFFRRRSICMV